MGRQDPAKVVGICSWLHLRLRAGGIPGLVMTALFLLHGGTLSPFLFSVWRGLVSYGISPHVRK